MSARLLRMLLVAFALPSPWAIADGLPTFPNLKTIPIPKDYGYGGFFARHGTVKIVFGVSDPGAQLKETLTNAAYVVRDLESRNVAYRIEVVLYSNAVLAADAFGQRYAGYTPLLEALAKQGVQFRVCYNSLVSLHQNPANVYDYMKVIPAGILQIVKKEMQGYAYVSNR
ncbi:MAG TPA: DsrE family protein [Usitatibacter sp.]|nr:DsrE family protein [Usitatibacter sp.]